jgi:hypothetical protein
VEKYLFALFHVVPPLPTSHSSSELLTAKSWMEAMKWKTVAKLGLSHLLPCFLMRNGFTRRCPKALQFFVFDSETAGEPVLHTKPHAALTKIVA